MKKNETRRLILRAARAVFWAVIFILAVFALASGVVNVCR